MNSNSRASQLIIFTDGSLTPQGAGAAVVITAANGQLVHLENKRLNLVTNNEAEYAALVLGLEIAANCQAQDVEIRADSEVIVNQMLGNFAVKSHRLRQLHWQVCQLARQFARVNYTRIERGDNALADTLAAEATMGRLWSIGVI
jgi:ribonuclease HI